MYAFTQESGHVVWREGWYAFMSKVSLQADLYMSWEDQVFVADVVVIDLMRDMVASSVISWPTRATTKLSVPLLDPQI
jgi:hypothetical protein